MSNARPFLNGLFPGLSVLSPLWPHALPDEPAIQPVWAEGANSAAEIAVLADPAVRALTMAGYQAQYLFFSADEVAGFGRNWLTVDLAMRVSDVSAQDSLEIASGGSPGVHLFIQARKLPAGAGADHSVPLLQDGMGWHSDFGAGAGANLVSFAIVAGATDKFKDKLGAIASVIESFIDDLNSTMQQTLGRTRNAGLFWLLNPDNWFDGGLPPPENDVFTSQLYLGAKRVFQELAEDTTTSSSNNTLSDFLRRQLIENLSLTGELARVDPIAKSREHYSARGLSKLLADRNIESWDARINLADAIGHSSWFDVSCMLVHFGLITPPLLDAPDVSGFFAASPPTFDPISVEMTNTSDTATGPQRLVISLYDTPLVTLTQHDRWLDLDRNGARLATPHILDNVAWEYLGIMPDGKHGLGLTAGRGVNIFEHLENVHAFELAILWTQVPNTIPKAVTTPIDLDNGEDVHLTSAQALGHLIQNRTAVYDCVIPAGVELDNMDRNSPPFLVQTPLENGGVKFEWFRSGGGAPLNENAIDVYGESIIDGEPEPPETPGGSGLPDNTTPAPQPSPEFTIILKPKNPMAGDFGFSFSIDYARLQSWDPFAPDITLWEIPFIPDGILFAYPLLLPIARGLSGAELSNSHIDKGLAYFRLWFAGEVEIQIDTHVDINDSFLPEFVRLSDPLDLPACGERLPCRLTHIEAAGGGFDGKKTYSAMLSPEEDDIPRWNGPEMPTLQRAEHAMVATAWPVKPPLTWPDVNLFIVDKGSPVTGEDATVGKIDGEISVAMPPWLWTAYQMGIDVGVGFIPVVGDIVDVAEFIYAASSGYDKWGNPVPGWQLGLMGLAALCPFVSNGMIKGVKIAGTGVVAGAVTTEIFAGDMTGNAPAGAMVRLWSALVRNADEAEKVAALGDAMSASSVFQKKTRAEQMAILKDVVASPALMRLATKVGGDVAAVLAGSALKFEDLITAEGAFIFHGMETSYTAWKKARGSWPEVNLTRRKFIESRKFTSGKWRLIFETFGVLPRIGRAGRSGTPQARVLWPGLAHLVLDGFAKRTPAEIGGVLKQAGAVAALKSGLPADAQSFVTRYQSELQSYLNGLSEAEFVALLGNKSRSSEEVLVVMAHLFHFADDACLKAGGSLADLDDLGPVLNELMKTGITRSGYQHGAVFEFFASLSWIRNPANAGKEFLLQMRFADDKLGPDLVEFADDGFAFVQYKSLSDLARQVGIASHQDNMVQLVKDMVRLSKQGWVLHADSVPAGMSNVFSGRYISVIDLDQFRKSGQMGLEELWRMGDKVIEFPDAYFYGDNMPAAGNLLRQIGEQDFASPGRYNLTSLEDYQRLMLVARMNPFDELLIHAAVFQATDMTLLIGKMGNKAELQIELADNPRSRRMLAGILNRNKDKASRIAADTLGDANGADVVFRELGVVDGWMDGATGINVEVVGMGERYLGGF